MMKEPIEAKLGMTAANTIRMLAVDAIQKSNSGHPGMPMGAADMAFVLWSRFLRFDPADPNWPGRDRFILSAGHGSMLQYALLHLFGFDLSMDDIKNFRQLKSVTPGHPEYGVTPGVELTTGPLGQGLANGVGMALAAKMTEARFAKDGFSPSGTRIFGIVSDGDLMEGVSYEAAAMAGHLKLGNLTYLYDSNEITIEGCTELAWSEDVQKRFEAAGWDVHYVTDGHDHEAIAAATQKAVDCTDKPSLVICRTHIGYGSPNMQDKSGCHGAPLGDEETVKTKAALGWPTDKKFYVPDDAAALYAKLAQAKKDEHTEWNDQLAAWKSANAQLSTAFDKWTAGEVPADLIDKMVSAIPEGAVATRAISGQVLQQAAKAIPNLFGGSADLSPSNKTVIQGEADIEPGNFAGRNMHYGIREHAMGSIANGLALYGGFIPYTATFLVFADYMRPTLRMAALMGLPVIFVFTHDSFWVGEDGPTHQPIEHVASLRLIPNLNVVRPADGIETACAWDMALKRTDGPTVLIFTRQKLVPFTRQDGFTYNSVRNGGYTAAGDADAPNVLLATGSEVATCIAAKKILKKQGIDVRVVSVPCLEAFEAQDDKYKTDVLGSGEQNVFWVEAGHDPGAWKYVKGKGTVIGLNRFGESAPGNVLADHFGFTPEKVAKKIADCL